MGADQEDSIDLRLLVDVPGDAEVPVSREALRDALEANRAQRSKRRLSSEAHIELALRHKQGEPATRLGRAYGISPGSVAQVVGRVERAAKRLRPTPAGTDAAAASATSATSSSTGQTAADMNDTPARQADDRLGGANDAHVDTFILDLLVHPAVVLDSNREVHSANQAWHKCVAAVPGDTRHNGKDLGVCLGAQGPACDRVDAIIAGVNALLDGWRSSFMHVYPCSIHHETRWFQLVAGSLCRSGGVVGALLQHVDITGPAAQNLVGLTPREKDILMGIVGGLSNKEIAHRDRISESAVKIHVRNIFKKLGVSNRTQAAMLGERLMLIGPDEGGDG